MRKVKFVVGEYYHIYNRGTDKRIIFQEESDLKRFFQSMNEFNTMEPIRSIRDCKYNKTKQIPSTPVTVLVDFVCYCLNPNHYHFIITPLVDGGIEKFMQRLGSGFTRYFNEKYHRNGVLFQGSFKAVHIKSDSDLLRLSVYVNLNNKVHKLSNGITQSSWNEYIGNNHNNFCNKDIVLARFNKKGEYETLAKSLLEEILKKRMK